MTGQWQRFLQLLLRDSIVAIGVLGLWQVLPAQATGGFGPIALSILAAVLMTFLGYVAHEWGHLVGALAARSAFELPATPFESFFLFRFDRARNSRAQFFAMALGGFAASILSVALLVALLPPGLLASRIALALVGLGVAATLIIEVPEFWRVWRGGPLPDGAAFVSGQKR